MPAHSIWRLNQLLDLLHSARHDCFTLPDVFGKIELIWEELGAQQ